MNRDQKAAVIDEVTTQLRDAEAVYAVDYRGTSVTQAADLRSRLRESDTRFRIVKNTLTERAADNAGAEALKPFLEGPTALVFVKGDAASAAKALADFKRASGLLEFKGGWMNGDTLSAAQIDAIAKLPSRDVLYGRLVGMVASPLTGLASAMSNLIGRLARQLGQIADQGLVGMVASPLTGLASAMGGLIGGLARQLQQIAERNVTEGESEERASRPAGETLNQED